MTVLFESKPEGMTPVKVTATSFGDIVIREGDRSVLLQGPEVAPMLMAIAAHLGLVVTSPAVMHPGDIGETR